jgi:hypothetical protein
LVINELNVAPVNTLVVVFFLFEFENVLHEELLKILIGVVDAKLLKALIFKTSVILGYYHYHGLMDIQS